MGILNGIVNSPQSQASEQASKQASRTPHDVGHETLLYVKQAFLARKRDVKVIGGMGYGNRFDLVHFIRLVHSLSYVVCAMYGVHCTVLTV